MKRISELDAMRGLAAVTIVVYHLWLPTYGFMGTALDLFFVMSGYLITAIVLKHQDEPGFLRRFYARRSLRIWPIYYLSLGVYLLINPRLPRPSPIDGLAYYLTYSQNLPEYWGAANPPFAFAFNHTWSLAVEEQYYLIWPLVLVLLGRRSLVPVALGLVTVAISARIGGYSRSLLITRCDGLALGGLLAWAMMARDQARISNRTMARSLVVLGLASVAFLGSGRFLALIISTPVGPTVLGSLRGFAINLMYVSLIGLVVLSAGHRRLGWLRDPRLVLLGQMSYGIYLYHHILFDIVQDYASAYGVTNRVLIDGIKLGTTFALAAASWRFVERPLLSLKDRVDYRPPAMPEVRVSVQVARREPLGSGAR